MAGVTRAALLRVKGLIAMYSGLAAFFGNFGIASPPVAVLNVQLPVKNNQKIGDVFEKILDRLIMAAHVV
jgi:hypothetical protein